MYGTYKLDCRAKVLELYGAISEVCCTPRAGGILRVLGFCQTLPVRRMVILHVKVPTKFSGIE